MSWLSAFNELAHRLQWTGSPPSMGRLTTFHGLAHYLLWAGSPPPMGWPTTFNELALHLPWAGSPPSMSWLSTFNGLAHHPQWAGCACLTRFSWQHVLDRLGPSLHSACLIDLVTCPVHLHTKCSACSTLSHCFVQEAANDLSITCHHMG